MIVSPIFVLRAEGGLVVFDDFGQNWFFLGFAYTQNHPIWNIQKDFLVLDIFDHFDAEKAVLEICRILQFWHKDTFGLAPVQEHGELVSGF